jgi:hypothetical protein
MSYCTACARETTNHDRTRHGLDTKPDCRRCETALVPEEARYIRMRVVGGRYVRETTLVPTETGPFCPACLPLALDPA